MSYEDFRKKYNWLFEKALYSPALNSIYEYILQHGWHYKVYDILFFNKQFDYEKEHPTEQMKEAARYYAAHEIDIAKCESLLSDEKSKRVYRKIIDFRCRKDRLNFPEHDVNNQYFPKDIIKLTDHEVFVDCGACRGDTYRRFRRETGRKYRKVICFETDQLNINYLHKTGDKDSSLVVIPKGAWSKETTLYFEPLGTKGTGHVVEKKGLKGLIEVPVCAIDSIEACKNATYIKMDIEGAEWEALHGAEETIKRNRPKLAICIYHNNEDYVRIIRYVHELNPNYHFYVRHHSTNTSETVLYAVE